MATADWEDLVIWYENQGTTLLGCIDDGACNYNPAANFDDGSYIYEGCFLDADFDGDNLVAAADFLYFLSEIGSQGDECLADLNSDQIVNIADLLIFLEYWQNSTF